MTDYSSTAPYAAHSLVLYRDRLIKAIAGDVRTLTDQSGESVTFRSVRELQAALTTIEGEIQRLRGGRNMTIKFQTSKGL